MADQLQQVLLWIVEEQGARSHSRKRGLARTEPEGFKSSLVPLVALGRDLEGKVIQCRSSWFVPVEPLLGKDMSLEVDQR